MKKKISIREFMDKLKITAGDLSIRIFHFNFIQVNTYVLYDETKEAVIIDPGNLSGEENRILSDFIKNEGLSVKYLINTHPHIDHIFGNEYGKKTFNASLLMHKAGIPIYEKADEYCSSYPFQRPVFPAPDQYIEAGDKITFGNQELRVLYTPGHCDGSVSLWDPRHDLVFTGDVLFEESIGRTDLPTGDLDLLIKGIRENLFTLADHTIVYPGHGDSTTIGKEKTDNPYL